MNCHNSHDILNRDYHTPTEWRHNSEQEIIAAEEQQELAQRLTLDADRLVLQTKDVVVKNLQEINFQSKVKTKDIEFKCKEIERQKYNLEEEIDLLLSYQTRIENTKQPFVSNALDVVDKCLKLRDRRTSIDLVFDDVQRELLRERELILGIEDQFENLLEKVVLQIRKLRAAVYNLDVDLNCKRNALDIESRNEKLDKNNVKLLSVLNNKNVFKPAAISVDDWDNFTAKHILVANTTLVESRPIRIFLDKCFNDMDEDLMAQSSAVDQAIRLRLEEYQEVIDKFNRQRNETTKNIGEVQEAVEKLTKAIVDHGAFMALSHARLENRARREGVELCRDELEARLFDEVTGLEDNARRLQTMKAHSADRLRHLKQTVVRIDVQLEVKENSLRTDSEVRVEHKIPRLFVENNGQGS